MMLLTYYSPLHKKGKWDNKSIFSTLCPTRLRVSTNVRLPYSQGDKHTKNLPLGAAQTVQENSPPPHTPSGCSLQAPLFCPGVSQPGRTGADDSQGAEAAAARRPLGGSQEVAWKRTGLPRRGRKFWAKAWQTPSSSLEWDPGRSKESRAGISWFNRGQITSSKNHRGKRSHTPNSNPVAF